MVIYADTLLIIDFSMDFLSLYITSMLLRLKRKPQRMAIAALLGAVYSVAAVIFDTETVPRKIIYIIIFCAVSVVMSAIAFGKSRKRIIKNTMTFIAASLFLGGGMTALYSMLSGITGIEPTGSSEMFSPTVFIIFAAVSAAGSGFFGKIKRKKAEQSFKTVKITAFGKTVTLNCLADSGNLLCEPFGKRRVTLVKRSVIENILPSDYMGDAYSYILKLSPELAAKFRLIPAKTVTGEEMLTGFIPDRMIVGGNEVDGIIAFTQTDFGEADGIVPDIY